MTDTLVIEVTAEDIAKGECTDPALCAIALAVARATGSRVQVGTADFALVNEADDELAVYDLPLEARVFIYAFDNNHTVGPFTFTATRKA